MKIFAFLSLFFLALPVTVNAQKELLKFEHPLIDAGTMTEDDAPRTFTFVGKNVSKKILHITQVQGTLPSYTSRHTFPSRTSFHTDHELPRIQGSQFPVSLDRYISAV